VEIRTRPATRSRLQTPSFSLPLPPRPLPSRSRLPTPSNRSNALSPHPFNAPRTRSTRRPISLSNRFASISPPTSPILEETDPEDGDYEETVLVVRRGRTVLEVNEKDDEEEREQLETTPTRRSERTTIVDDDILHPFATLPRRSRQPPRTLPLPIPSPAIVDTLPCSRRFVPNPSHTSLSSHDRFLSLSKLPGRSKPLPGRFVTSFQDVARRLAKAYLDNPSEGTLLDFLAFPKVGVIPALRTKNPRAFIEQYPNVRWPEAGMIGRGRSARDAVVKAVENGKLGTAARLLEGKSMIAEIDDVTLSVLDSKHPTGPSSPFGPTVGPTQGRAPTAEDVQAVLDDFKADVSPGISGWTVPLLRQAARTTEVMDVLVSLTGSIGANVAPGSSMLTTSRLTPLVKPDGGIRPIACGELIYRLATKALLKKAFKPDFLEAFQLGVGSKGGVEPIVRLVERATFGDLRAKWSHLVCLDASNAFNHMDRRSIATATKQFAPALYRTAKWAYNSPSELIVGDVRLSSSQGVRQGDPLGPLLFSLGLRPTLKALSTHLGPNRMVVAYLDDILILSDDDSAMTDAQAFLSSHTEIIRLNASKCRTLSLDSIRQDGLELLGTVVGPPTTRRQFLSAKVGDLRQSISKLHSLPHQTALILLRTCLQQNLRHLQRTLKTDDLLDIWDELDEAIWSEVERLRGRTGPDSEEGRKLAIELTHLPARLGGLGLLSHRDCAHHAYAAANEASDVIIGGLLGDLGDSDEERGQRRSQKARCEEMWNEKSERIVEGLGDIGRKLLIENSTTFGRKWLSSIPYFQPLRLTDYDISTGLHYRTLASGSRGICKWCGDENRLGHDEVCMRRNRWAIRRHDEVKRAMFKALVSLDNTIAETEPDTAEGRRRNDIRISGRGVLGRLDFDIKVYSLVDADATKTTTRAEPGVTLRAHAQSRTLHHLSQIEKRTIARAPQGIPSNTLRPLVLSAGGLVAVNTANELRRWREAMASPVWQTLTFRVSLDLLRARSRLFEV